MKPLPGRICGACTIKVIYQAENAIDANLLSGLLEQAGIKSFVNGQYLQGGIGELPAAGLITVSVGDDFEHEARRVVEQFESDLRGQRTWEPSDQLFDWTV